MVVIACLDVFIFKVFDFALLLEVLQRSFNLLQFFVARLPQFAMINQIQPFDLNSLLPLLLLVNRCFSQFKDSFLTLLIDIKSVA